MNTNNYAAIGSDRATTPISRYGLCRCYNLECMTFINVFLFSILVFALMYVATIVIALLYVYLSMLFKSTMISIIGVHAYNVTFPVCSSTKYLGNDCYTATNTYCN